MTNFKEGLKAVKAFVFDVDGVLSSPEVFLHPTGEIMRSMNTKDGYALQYAVKHGYPVAIITGGNTESVAMRFKGLGITDIYLASSYKLDDFKDFLFKYDLEPGDVLYMGDDLPDLEVMKMVGIPCCPADAVEEIKSVAHYISPFKGGKGCVRDVMEQVLRLQGRWNNGEPFTW
jgi:3-deoxy-D-manno-octulosonate 8-phosphate phosphatase (KDO 8-P phosphatase)